MVDFDVHHGNGTQAAFETDGDLFYASTHQWPLYPGTGAPGETGVGNIVNLPLAAGSGSAEFRHAMSENVLPALEAFRPDMILVSAGFDAHRDDPLAGLNFCTEDYGWATARLSRSRTACAAVGWFRCWKAVTTCRRWRRAWRRMSGRWPAPNYSQTERKLCCYINVIIC